MTLRHQRTIVQAGALFVLTSVMLPAIVYMGHWNTAAVNHDHAGEAHNTAHADHCHVGPAKCSGGVSTVGTWWVGDGENGPEPETIPSLITVEYTLESGTELTARVFQPPRLA
jgi:hypothetical protein